MHHFGTKFSLGISFIVRHSFMLRLNTSVYSILIANQCGLFGKRMWTGELFRLVSNPFVLGRENCTVPPLVVQGINRKKVRRGSNVVPPMVFD